MMTFDNEFELHKIKAHFENAELILRIRVDDSKSCSKLSSKFGADPNHSKKLLATAKCLNLNVIGVSFHVGSYCYSARSFYEAVKSAKYVFNVAEEIGYNFHLLDVGGGFPGTNEDKISFKNVSSELNKGFKDFFPASSGVRIIAEPGRFFVASAFTEACNVISLREVKTGHSGEFMYYLNDGVYGSFNSVLVGEYYPTPYSLEENVNEIKFKCSIWGPTCDSLDCISKETHLPKLRIGDWILFNNMGAYTCALASNFNGFKPPIISYICRKNNWDQVEHIK